MTGDLFGLVNDRIHELAPPSLAESTSSVNALTKAAPTG
jgi:hypothetical protein